MDPMEIREIEQKWLIGLESEDLPSALGLSRKARCRLMDSVDGLADRVERTLARRGVDLGEQLVVDNYMVKDTGRSIQGRPGFYIGDRKLRLDGMGVRNAGEIRFGHCSIDIYEKGEVLQLQKSADLFLDLLTEYTKTDKEGRYRFRIRSVHGSDERVVLSSKLKARHIEKGMPVESNIESQFYVLYEEAAHWFMENLGFVKGQGKTKRRKAYLIDEIKFEIVRIDGCGVFLEIEHKGSVHDIARITAAIYEFAAELGVPHATRPLKKGGLLAPKGYRGYLRKIFATRDAASAGGAARSPQGAGGSISPQVSGLGRSPLGTSPRARK
jgi:predicted adenylyl cyclase CyaB